MYILMYFLCIFLMVLEHGYYHIGGDGRGEGKSTNWFGPGTAGDKNFSFHGWEMKIHIAHDRCVSGHNTNDSDIDARYRKEYSGQVSADGTVDITANFKEIGQINHYTGTIVNGVANIKITIVQGDKGSWQWATGKVSKSDRC